MTAGPGFMLPCVTPAQHVRIVLAAHRERDPERVAFDRAWRSALATLPRGVGPAALAELEEWRGLLRWARPWFMAAYESIGNPSAPPDPPVAPLGRESGPLAVSAG